MTTPTKAMNNKLKIVEQLVTAFSRCQANSMLNLLDAEVSRRNLGLSRLIFVASMPKAGTTFVTRKLAEYTGWRWGHISDQACEFDIYRPTLIEAKMSSVVIQQHTLGTKGNLDYLKRCNASVFVLLRNIYEALYSMRNHLLEEGVNWPFMSVPEQYPTLDLEAQMDFLIDAALPWYLHFTVSWLRAQKNEILDTPIVFLDYENLKANEFEFMRQLVKNIPGVPVDPERLQSVLTEQRVYGTGKNYRKRDKAGNGIFEKSAVFTPGQLERIRSMGRHYQDIDLSVIKL